MEKVKILILALLLATGTQVFANDDIDPEIQIVTTAPNSFKLVYTSTEDAPVKVNIYNEKSRRIFSDLVYKTNRFSKLYNFKNLSSGLYTFEVIANGQTSKEKVYYAPKTAKQKMKAFVRQLEGSKKFRLLVMGNEMEPVTVRIYNKSNELVHEKSFDSKTSIGQVYNLNSIKASEIRFVVSSGSEVLKAKDFKL